MRSTGYRYGVAIVRVLVAALVLAALVGQLERSIAYWTAHNLNVGFQTVNFFSFFTIESNVACVVVLVIGAVIVFARKQDADGLDAHWYTVFRVIVVTYMAVTGIVYNLLLRGIELPQGTTVEWSNEILHVVGPAYLVLDWILAPGRSALGWRTLRAIVVFPILWVVYTLIRGPLAITASGKPWYPYPFLDPGLAHEGYFSVAFYVILIALVICATGAGAIWISRRGTSEVTA